MVVTCLGQQYNVGEKPTKHNKTEDTAVVVHSKRIVIMYDISAIEPCSSRLEYSVCTEQEQ